MCPSVQEESSSMNILVTVTDDASGKTVNEKLLASENNVRKVLIQVDQQASHFLMISVGLFVNLYKSIF